jgi:hypothetical protein
MLKFTNEMLNDILGSVLLEFPEDTFGSGKTMTMSLTSIGDSSTVSGNVN